MGNKLVTKSLFLTFGRPLLSLQRYLFLVLQTTLHLIVEDRLSFQNCYAILAVLAKRY